MDELNGSVSERIEVATRVQATLVEVLEQPAGAIVRDAAIQRFEYSLETVWKAAQAYLRVHEGIDVGSPKGAVRSSREAGLLTDMEATLALEMIDDRKLTVHAYNEAIAARIAQALPGYRTLLQSWLAKMSPNAVR